jgi:hypothetical protein
MSIEQSYNTEPLLKDLHNVICKGLNQIMKDYITDHQLYKETYESVLKIAGIQKQTNVITKQSFDEDSKTIKQSIAEMTQEMVQHEVQKLGHSLERKMDEFTKNNNLIIVALIKKIENLKNEILELKQTSIANDTTTEKENIVLKMEEEAEEDEEEAEEDEEEAEEEEAEEEAEEAEEAEEEEAEEEEEEADEEEEQAEEAEEEADEAEEEADDEAEEEAEEEEAEEELKEEEQEQADEEAEEEEEEELMEIEIDDITYCTNDEENGFIYNLDKDGEVGEKVGYIKDGEPFFYPL